MALLLRGGGLRRSGCLPWVRLNTGEGEHRIFLDPPMENNFKAHREPKEKPYSTNS